MPLVKIPKIPANAQFVDLDIEAKGRYPVLWDNVLTAGETITAHNFYSTSLKANVPNLSIISTSRALNATVVKLEATVESQLNQSFIITAGIETSTGGRHSWSFIVIITRVFLPEEG